MNIDPNKWVKTLPNSNKDQSIEKNTLDPNIWLGTISKEKTNRSNSKKYFLVTSLLIIGLMSVPIIKNTTRDLQNEISSLRKSINDLKLELHQTKLDYNVITSPENISILAKENLGNKFDFYKKSQILKFKNYEVISKQSKVGSNLEKKDLNKENKVKKIVLQELKKKKNELKKIKEISSNPKEIPSVIKSNVTSRIQTAEKNLKKFYESPKEIVTPERTKRWAAVQVVKAFFGFPIIPGK